MKEEENDGQLYCVKDVWEWRQTLSSWPLIEDLI